MSYRRLGLAVVASAVVEMGDAKLSPEIRSRAAAFFEPQSDALLRWWCSIAELDADRVRRAVVRRLRG